MENHLNNGNCLESMYDCQLCGTGLDVLCDVCHEHDMPRGDCDECEICYVDDCDPLETFRIRTGY